MTRAIWIWRLIGAAVMIGLMLLMLNLYVKLRRMSGSQAPPAATAPEQTP